MRGWLYTILYNRFLTDKHRQRRRRVADALLEVAETELPGVDGGQNWALAHRDLLLAFAALPEEQRSVALLIGSRIFLMERPRACWAYRSGR